MDWDTPAPGEAAEAGVVDVEDPPSPVATALAEIAADLSGLRETVHERLQYDATKDEAFRKLYIDLEHFRGQAAFVQTRPLYIDLILLVDRVEGSLVASTGAAKGETKTSTPRSEAERGLLTSIRDELLEILARRSVEPVVCEQGAAFDPHVQRAIKVEPTSMPAEHNLTHFVRRGYQADGQLLRPEDVVVLRHTPTPPPELT
jgi:molecular chaperone GrpE